MILILCLRDEFFLYMMRMLQVIFVLLQTQESMHRTRRRALLWELALGVKFAGRISKQCSYGGCGE